MIFLQRIQNNKKNFLGGGVGEEVGLSYLICFTMNQNHNKKCYNM